MGKSLLIKSGDIFNNLTILEEVERKGGYRFFCCKCICGSIKDYRLNSLTTGNAKSCGCVRNKRFYKKDKLLHRNNRLYHIWSSLKQRCNNSKNPRFFDYGGRGITYDKKWETYDGFLDDMLNGYSDDLTIDRINNNGNYCKENCRWATKVQQSNNRRNNVYINIDNEIKTLTEWVRLRGNGDNKIFYKYKKGIDIKKYLV